MGHMKDLDRRIRQGGDDAVAAACELAGIVKERRGYSDITDIVTVLRSIGFASVPPSASLLHYCVTHAADEIEHLRRLSANGDCPDRDNAANEDNTPATHGTPSERSEQSGCTLTDEEREAVHQAAIRVEALCQRGSKHMAATLRSLLERTK